MKIIEQNLLLNWSVLFVGLKEHFVTPDQIIESILKENLCSEDILLELIEVQDDYEQMLKKLELLSNGVVGFGLRVWQLAYLMEIKESNKEIKQKLEDVEKLWSRFGYPETWRDFIYYVPTDRTNSPELVYVNLISYINEEKNLLLSK